MKKVFAIILIMIVSFTFLTCSKKSTEETPITDPLADVNNTYGFGILNKLKGIWNGPVTSTTAIGSFPEWIVDFRPISENQISAKNELDEANDIHMTYFIAKFNGQYRVCFRNGGSFSGNTRVSYFLADSVSETATSSYYRFKEIVIGKRRAYTEVLFRNDSMYMSSYTNIFNTLPAATLHMAWSAKRQDTTSCQTAVNFFGFPKKSLTKDFSSTFTGAVEAIYYNIGTGDPYSELQQPYLGQATISYTYGSGYIPDPAKKVLVLITTQPLISGFNINIGNLIYRSRYVVLAANNPQYVFNYMHPGNYYLYALYDHDGNREVTSGDWVSTTNVAFSLSPLGTTTASTQINFTIP